MASNRKAATLDKCDRGEVASKRKAATPGTEKPKSKRKTRGFGADLDPTAQGIFETNERK